MPTLRETLDRLFAWFQINAPEKAAEFQPGLSLTEIKAQTDVLEFHLPKEVYTLYQWKNGLSTYETFGDFYDGYTFLPLDIAVEEYFRWNGTEFWDPMWFPIFNFEAFNYVVEGDKEEKESSPVYLVDIKDIGNYRYYYKSLHGMMLTILECYETGVCFVDQMLEWDDPSRSRQEAIRLRHNPGAA